MFSLLHGRICISVFKRSWQYNVCGAVAGVVSAYLFTSTSLAVKLGVISKERLQESVAQPVAAPPEEVKRHVVVPKHLISFNDLRKPLVYACLLPQTAQYRKYTEFTHTEPRDHAKERTVKESLCWR